MQICDILINKVNANVTHASVFADRKLMRLCGVGCKLIDFLEKHVCEISEDLDFLPLLFELGTQCSAQISSYFLHWEIGLQFFRKIYLNPQGPSSLSIKVWIFRNHPTCFHPRNFLIFFQLRNEEIICVDEFYETI